MQKASPCKPCLTDLQVLRITQKYKDGDQTYYQYATAWPIGTLLAQTWGYRSDLRLRRRWRRDGKEFGIGCWLAPGMNIHRNALCGRNFEYYSEDPVVVRYYRYSCNPLAYSQTKALALLSNIMH